MRVGTLLIVGVGLVGGSIALAARRRGVADRVLGVDQDPEALERGQAHGILDESCSNLAAAVGRANLVIFSTPVDTIAGQVIEAAPHCRPGTLLTDVGSTKARLIAQIESNPLAPAAFVGSHPLAGSEKQGAQHADADLLVNRVVVVTPTPLTDGGALARIVAFWESLGASVRQLSPRDHDDALALTSHLPHLLAAALAGILPPHWYELTASGFRDTTRLAASNPALWASILQANPEAVLHGLDRLLSQLQHFRDALVDDDGAALLALLEQGRRVKDELR